MNDEQLERLFKYMAEMQKDITDMKSELSENVAKKDDIDKVYNILDKYFKYLETDETERQALGAQVGRLQDWAERSSSKIGVEFTR